MVWGSCFHEKAVIAIICNEVKFKPFLSSSYVSAELPTVFKVSRYRFICFDCKHDSLQNALFSMCVHRVKDNVTNFIPCLVLMFNISPPSEGYSTSTVKEQ